MPGAGSLTESINSLAGSLPASWQSVTTTIRSSPNNEGLKSSTASTVVMSPARMVVTGTERPPGSDSVAACARTAATMARRARSFSSSSLPTIKFTGATALNPDLFSALIPATVVSSLRDSPDFTFLARLRHWNTGLVGHLAAGTPRECGRVSLRFLARADHTRGR